MESKKRICVILFALLAVLLVGHILNNSVAVLLAVAVICISILLFDSYTSTCILFFFFPLSYIFAYNQYSVCIFLAVAYILKTVTKGKIYTSAFYTIILLAYCLMFADYSVGNVKLGTMIPPILISLLIFVCEEVKQSDYLTMINHFKNGFIVSAIIGFFKEQLPSISRLFDSDFVNDSGAVDSNMIERYSGLSYDPNFFTVINCILIAILLFTTEKMSLKKGIELLFLVVTGFLTFSKSYILLLSIIAVIYLFRRSKYVGRNIAIIVGMIVAVVAVQRFTDFDLISIILGRFETSGGAEDLTTGRLELWREYLNYILSKPEVCFWGEGFNALPVNIKAVHNTYIDFWYRFGLVGSTLWIVYLFICFRTVKNKNMAKSDKATNIPLTVCLLGFLFLSAYHFQQLWCCICLCFFALNIPKEGKNA
ncbi:MAG: O-antigen ligase family protein [Clostridia bacterium]|nr:O-antigen ligase family protein [Clostridia bacterium]